MPSATECQTESGYDPDRGGTYYERFYADGGWKYAYWREWWWHKRHVVRRFGLRRGMRLLEVACGCGFHTNLFHRMGFACEGLDRSRAGIERARRSYPAVRFHCCDLDGDLPVAPGSLDVVLARGCSHYHYDLAAPRALDTSRKLLTLLKPGGVFVMVIVTDLSGRRPADGVWQNTRADYERHFASFGRRYSVDWQKGMAICGLFNTPERTEARCPTAEPLRRMADA